MSKLKNLSRKLNINRVSSAISVHDKRKELAFDMIRERAGYDKEFAVDLLTAVGKNLPKDILEIANKTVTDVKLENVNQNRS